MRDNQVTTADATVSADFNDANQKHLADCLTHQQSLTGVLGKLFTAALDQGQATYRDLVEMQLIYIQCFKGMEELVSIVTGLRPIEVTQAFAILNQGGATLSIHSEALKSQPHPLAQD
jgi:hypothetical protein